MFHFGDKRYLDYQVEVMSRQVEEVNDIYMKMRGWRHDYHNHLQKLKAHLAMGQIEEARNYLNQLEGDLDSINVKYATGNVSLDAILNSKLSMAENAQIRVNCKAQIGETPAIEDIDLCVIIGNLIDNAVESCRKMPADADRFLRIYVCVRRRQLYIAVTNSTSETVRKLDAAYISNKRGDHGHGLKRIDLVVEKYSGYVRRANEPGVFSTEIMLPL